MVKERKPRKRKRLEGSLTEQQVSSSPGEFFNRELSWLEFNRRILYEARDRRTPLLERVRFLSIFSSNLDEFFMNRVGALKQRLSVGVHALSPDGLSTEQQLQAIRRVVVQLLREQTECYQLMIGPALADNKISIIAWEQLNDVEREHVTRYYNDNVFPILTPQAVDPGHPFPFISNLSTSLGVMLRSPDREEQLFARVKVPAMLPQLIRVNSDKSDDYRFVTLSSVIEHNLHGLFQGMVISSVMPFRLTRNAEIEIDAYDGDDLVELIEEGLRERRFSRGVRLEHGPNPDPLIRRLLIEELELTEEDVYEQGALLDFAVLKEIADLSSATLRYEPWIPITPPALSDEETSIFTAVKAADVLVHHPYENFATTVERFLRTAVDDPKVVAIKMTLYRTGEKSSLVPLLIRAATNEKQVVCLIEVKASFDEARNIRLAQALEDAGVHVMYGVVGLKTHAKTMLVVRQEPEGIRCYAHISTGNYNSTTARVYTDFSLFTARPEICDDLVELFHYLTGRSMKRNYRSLIVAPHDMRESIIRMLDREIEHHRAGAPTRIVMKCNSLEDVVICRALAKAGLAGVRVDLIVRGICCLKPGVPSQTPNISVFSVTGRFLEHSRMFYFQNGKSDPLEGEMYISSADLMYRNLSRRVEVAVPLLERSSREKIWELFSMVLEGKHTLWRLNELGEYKPTGPNDAADAPSVQQALMKLTRERSRHVLSDVVLLEPPPKVISEQS